MGAKIKQPHGKTHIASRSKARFAIWCHCYIQIRQINKDMYGLQICYSAKATTKWLENQSSQGCMAEAMQQLDEILQQVNPFAESYNQIHE
jgi:hypothetical protein